MYIATVSTIVRLLLHRWAPPLANILINSLGGKISHKTDVIGVQTTLWHTAPALTNHERLLNCRGRGSSRARSYRLPRSIFVWDFLASRRQLPYCRMAVSHRTYSRNIFNELPHWLYRGSTDEARNKIGLKLP
jgi:hypothetical protein